MSFSRDSAKGIETMKMKKTLIIAAAVNLLLCGGIQAMSASGWKIGEKSYYRYVDANGEVFFVRNPNVPATRDLVDGFELPEGTYVLEDDGTFIPPTILNVGSIDDNPHADPSKWRSNGNRYEIVSSVEEMTDLDVSYILRNGSESVGYRHAFKTAYGDHGVPVYNSLPDEVVEGQTIAVGGRKYVGRVKPVLDRYYTNMVSPENITVDHRYSSSGALQSLDGFIAISGIQIPEHIMEKARNGEPVTVRFKGLSMELNDGQGYGYGAATLQYYKDGKLLLNSAASQIYTQKDTDPQSDENVWTFQLYYRTSNNSAANNRYNGTMAHGDTIYLSGGVSPTSPVPFNYDLSKVVVTFDEIIGETYEDRLVWDYVGEYEAPMPDGFYPVEEMRIVDMEEDMEDVRVHYVLSIDGKEYFYADYMNALLRLPDGTVRYYVEGKAQHAGACMDFDGNVYYINHTRDAVTDCEYTFVDAKGNHLLPGGTYHFNEQGICDTLPEVIDSSDSADFRNGLVRVPGGGVRYLKEGVPQHYGLARDKYGNYYYINNSTYAVTNDTYGFVEAKGNGLIPGGIYQFDANGHITNLPEVIDGGNPVDIQNGLIRFPDGSVRYLVDGKPIHKGLVRDVEGNYYYINNTTYAVKDVYYPTWKNNDLLTGNGHSFDQNGVLINIDVPLYWRPALQRTIANVQQLMQEIGPDAITFVQVSDMHINAKDRVQQQQWLGALAANIMNQCDIPYAIITGDNNSRSVNERPDNGGILADVAMQDSILSAIGWNRIGRILGNHDGVWGNDNYYYDRLLSMDEKYEVFFSRSMKAYLYYDNIAKTVGTNDKVENATYYYLDDEATKTRYINLNVHWAKYEVDDRYHSDFNSFVDGYHYGQDQLDWLAHEALDLEEGWTVAVFTHVPAIEYYGPVTENGHSTYQYCKDQYILMGILDAYAARTAYKADFTHYGDWRNVHVSVDYSVGSELEAKGEIAGLFTGHTHQDSISYDSSKYFPVITLRTAGGLGTGDAYEVAFDTVVIDPETKIIHMVRTGVGYSRTAMYTPDGSGVTIVHESDDGTIAE